MASHALRAFRRLLRVKTDGIVGPAPVQQPSRSQEVALGFREPTTGMAGLIVHTG